MGGIGLFILDDDTNVGYFPQTLADFSNRAVAELGFRGSTDSERFAGVHLHLEKLGIHGGMWVNQPGLVPRYSFTNIADHGRQNVFGIASEEGTWGAQVGIGGDSWELKPDADPADGTLTKETAQSIMGAVGVDFDYAETATGEASVKVGIGSAKQEFQGGDEVKESLLDVRGLLRNVYDRGEHGKLVATGTVNLGSSKIDYPTASARGGALNEDKATSLSAGIGLGWHYPVKTGITVIAGLEPIGFATAKDELTYETSREEDKITAISYISPFFAMEAEINGWLTGRVGASQSNTMIKTENTFEDTSRGDPVTDEQTLNESAFQISFGLGVKLGDNFMVDGVFNEDLLYNGPNFVTGDNEVGDFLSRVSVWGWWD